MRLLPADRPEDHWGARLPDWIRKASDDLEAGATYFRRKCDGTVETWRQVAYTTKVNDVCEPCNTGWMSTIEAAVSDRLAPMMFEGARVTLAADDLRAVATWVTLRALVIQLATGQHEVPAEHYATLEQKRAPLLESQVWLAALDGTDAHSAFFLGATLDADTGAEPDGYVATLAVGKLVARIFILTDGHGEFGGASNGPLDDYLVSIWPAVNSIEWPPAFMNFDAYSRLTGTLPTAFVAAPAPPANQEDQQ